MWGYPALYHMLHLHPMVPEIHICSHLTRVSSHWPGPVAIIASWLGLTRNLVMSIGLVPKMFDQPFTRVSRNTNQLINQHPKDVQNNNFEMNTVYNRNIRKTYGSKFISIWFNSMVQHGLYKHTVTRLDIFWRKPLRPWGVAKPSQRAGCDGKSSPAWGSSVSNELAVLVVADVPVLIVMILSYS